LCTATIQTFGISCLCSNFIIITGGKKFHFFFNSEQDCLNFLAPFYFCPLEFSSSNGNCMNVTLHVQWCWCYVKNCCGEGVLCSVNVSFYI
jgi:hypothetical protein